MIRIFISSTFKDFQYERDLMNKIVAPNFREAALQHGSDVELLDLRWGLNTYHLSEGDAANRVVSVCLNEIDNTRPYLIIFISERFGWIPKEKYIPAEFAEKIPVAGKSVTALEIAYGIRDEKTAERCIICMRKICGEIPDSVKDDYIEKDSDAKSKLDALKDELRKNHGDRIIDYTAEFNTDGTLGNFKTADGRNLAEVLIERMKANCEQEWLKYDEKSWQVREQISAWQFIEDRAERFIGREELVKTFQDKLEGTSEDKLEGTGHVFIKGEHGSGKTSIVCKIADNLRKKGKDVLCLFAGSSTYSDNAQSLLDQIIFFIEDLLHQNHFTPAEDEKTAYISRQLRLIELDKMLPRDKKIFLLVDAVDQLAADSHRDRLDFLPNYSANIDLKNHIS